MLPLLCYLKQGRAAARHSLHAIALLVGSAFADDKSACSFCPTVHAGSTWYRFDYWLWLEQCNPEFMTILPMATDHVSPCGLLSHAKGL